MASLGSKARALEYFKRLLDSSNPKLELQRIHSDLNKLIYTATKKPIERKTKIEILEELEQLVRQAPSLESIHEEYAIYDSIRRTTASDNSEILDVISAMKKRAE